jgi:hypothetical protein
MKPYELIRSLKPQKMINKILVLVFFSVTMQAFSQNIYSTQYESQADLSIFVVDYEGQCDLKVYKVDYSSQAEKNKGLWYFVDYESQADKKIFFVDYEGQADLNIFFVDYASQAGWRDKSKMHLMF